MSRSHALHSRRTFLRLTGLGAAGIGLAACGGGGEAAAPAEGGTLGSVSVQLSWIKNIEFGGEFMADSRGYYTEAGLESVELISGPVDSADALVLAGNVTVGISAPDATGRFIVEQGAPLKIIGTTFQKNPFCILSIEEGTPIRTVADLAGKRIGIQAGTNQTIFGGLLAANGIDPASVEQVVVQYEPTPLTERTVDGFMSFLTNEPFLVAADGFTPVTLPFADNGLPLVSESFVVLQETIDNDRDLLKAFLVAEIRGWNDAVADPAESARLAVEVYGADLGLDIPGQTEQAIAQNDLIVSDDTRANGLFTMTDELVGEVITALERIGVTITAEELFDLSLLDEVYAENPDLITG
ncbi:MAG: ABC transporter substrate-binding protein [Pseudonocardiales bacterium]|jgi:ABC-type nitrate/sulfonate/bicarbonate transport system substrate-binding protein|nr:ABC transporter substrate-binding protein [Pseudonocardiales bacterium]